MSSAPPNKRTNRCRNIRIFSQFANLIAALLSASGQRWFLGDSVRHRSAAFFPAQQAPAGEPKPSPDEDRGARRRQTSDALTGEAAGFASVQEAEPGSQLAARIIARKRLPLHDFGRAAVERELRPLIGSPTVSGIDGECHRTAAGRR